MSTEKNKKIKKFWSRYESKIVLFVGLFLIGVISFQLGVLQGQNWQQDPLVIEKASDGNIFQLTGVLGESSENNSKKKISSTSGTEVVVKSGKCSFVGSKNSDKYHKMDCRWATQIKSDNIVCFNNVDDAKSKGYILASCMK